jgi:hypothetical protein
MKAFCVHVDVHVHVNVDVDGLKMLAYQRNRAFNLIIPALHN